MSVVPFPSRPVTAADYAEVRRRLVIAVAQQCPAWLRADADDIVQQAMLRVSSAGAVVVNATYLRRVAYSATIDELRKRRSQRSEPLEPGTETATDAPGDNPGGVAEARRLGEAIRHCLSGLIESRRRAVGLHLEGHSAHEIAGLLGTERKNAENLIYRGLDDLRTCLAGKGFTP